jgi:hypothetical protein
VRDRASRIESHRGEQSLALGCVGHLDVDGTPHAAEAHEGAVIDNQDVSVTNVGASGHQLAADAQLALVRAELSALFPPPAAPRTQPAGEAAK